MFKYEFLVEKWNLFIVDCVVVCLGYVPNLTLIIIMTELPQSITYIFLFVFKENGANNGSSGNTLNRNKRNKMPLFHAISLMAKVSRGD